MKPRYTALPSLIVLGILIVTCAGAATDPHYALATAGSELYIFRDQGKWDTKSWSRLLSVTDHPSALAGVATDGRYVYVADNVAGTLTVGTIGDLLGTPTWTEVAPPIVLKNSDDTLRVDNPTQIAVDRSGGVYVVGGPLGTSLDSNFAYVKPTAGDWTTPIVSIGQILNSTLADVAVSNSGANALIAFRRDDPSTATSYTCKATEDAVSAIRSLLPKSFNARAVAVDPSLGTDGYAYVVNNNSDSPPTKGSVRVVDAATGEPRGSSAIELVPNMRPDDVATFTIGEDHYLGITGLNAGAGEAWKVLLDKNSDWVPILTEGSVDSAPIPTAGHHCAASSDGEVFWYTSANGTMGALDAGTWMKLAPTVFDGTIGGMIKLENVTTYAPVPIPEPSSLLSLAGLLGAGLGLLRRRNANA